MIKPLGDAFATSRAFFPHMGFLFLSLPYGVPFSFISEAVPAFSRGNPSP